MHDQGYTRSVIIEVFLEPESMLAQHVTMIGREQYHCIVAQPGLAQGIQQISEHVVEVGNVGQVTVPGCTHMRLGDASIEQGMMQNSVGVGFARCFGLQRCQWHWDIVMPVSIPVLLQSKVGLMWVCKRS